MLSRVDVRYAAAKLLLRKSKDPTAANVQGWPEGAALKLSACLFVLFVQEYLVLSQSTILGTRIHEIYVEMQSLLHECESITQEAFAAAVEKADLAGSATELLRQPGVIDAIWATGDLDALWSSAARGALHTVEEMTVYSADGNSETLDFEYDDFNSLPPRPPHHAPAPDDSGNGGGSTSAAAASASVAQTGTTFRRSRRGTRASRTNNNGGDDANGAEATTTVVDDPLTEGPRPSQRRLTRRFADPSLESGFRLYIFRVMGMWFKVALYTLTLTVLGLNIIFLSTLDLPKEEMMYTGFVGDRKALGLAVSFSTMLLPFIWTLTLSIGTLRCTTLYTPRSYGLFVGLSSAGTVLMFGLPVHAIDGFGDTTGLYNCTLLRHPDGSESCVSANVANRAGSHIAGSLLSYIATAFFSPEPVVTCLLLIILATTHLLRARFLWMFHDCLNVIRLMLPYHAGSLLLAIFFAYMQSHVMRRQFLMRLELQRIKDARIEQLGMEKERLDYERAFALKQQQQAVEGAGGVDEVQIEMGDVARARDDSK